MIRRLFFAAALLGASTAAFAHGGRGYDAPYVSFFVGTGPYSGMSMSYSSGRYWVPTVYTPIVVTPAPRYRVYAAPPAYGHRYRHRHHDRRHERRHDHHHYRY